MIVTGERKGADPEPGLNLMTIRAVGATVRWGGFPMVPQAVMLAALIGLAWLGWGQLTPKGIPDKLYAKANLVNLAVWGLFWPGVVWATVLFGRVLCAVCPLELISNASERLGRWMGISRKNLPKWLRAGWLMVLLYALLQMTVAGLHLHRVPAYTSVFLWGMVAMAAGTGLVWRDRAYCRGFCPVAPLLKVYGRGGALAVRAADRAVCGQCKDKMCASAALRRQLDARSCPSLLNPAKLQSSEDCLLCAQCLKSCTPGNLQLLARVPFAVRGTGEAASWPVAVFVMVLSGFVSSEVASEWAAAKALFAAPVEWAVRAWQAKAYAGWVEGVWTIAVYPALLWAVLGGMAMMLGAARGMGEAVRRLALPVALVIAAGHMAKGLAKFVSWAGFLPVAWNEPAGTVSAAAMVAKTMPQPASLLPLSAVSAIGTGLVLAAVWLAMREARGGLRVPVAALGALFAFTVLGWGFLQ